MEEAGPAGVDSTLIFENSDNMMELPIIKYDQKQVWKRRNKKVQISLALCSATVTTKLVTIDEATWISYGILGVRLNVRSCCDWSE